MQRNRRGAEADRVVRHPVGLSSAEVTCPSGKCVCDGDLEEWIRSQRRYWRFKVQVNKALATARQFANYQRRREDSHFGQVSFHNILFICERGGHPRLGRREYAASSKRKSQSFCSWPIGRNTG